MTPEERVRIRKLGIVEVFFLNQWHSVRSPIYSGVLADRLRRCIAEAVAEERERMQAELDATREERDAAIHLVRNIERWAVAAFEWQAFWDDAGWSPESAFDKNGKKLRDVIAECREMLGMPIAAKGGGDAE